MDKSKTSSEKLQDLHKLIEHIEIALLTTRQSDGSLTTRPMATQKSEPFAGVWFVTDVESAKVDEIRRDPHVCLGYFNRDSMEWVSLSGKATINQDRSKIRELYQPDWKAWFADEGGERDGGPDDPRLTLILVEATDATYYKAEHSKPRILFEVARGILTGKKPDVGEETELDAKELRSKDKAA